LTRLAVMIIRRGYRGTTQVPQILGNPLFIMLRPSR